MVRYFSHTEFLSRNVTAKWRHLAKQIFNVFDMCRRYFNSPYHPIYISIAIFHDGLLNIFFHSPHLQGPKIKTNSTSSSERENVLLFPSDQPENYFISFQGSFPASCQYCSENPLTIQHLFSRPALEITHLLHSVFPLLYVTLCTSEQITKSLNYLRSTYFFKSF